MNPEPTIRRARHAPSSATYAFAVALVVIGLVPARSVEAQVTRVSSLEAWAPGESGVLFVDWGGLRSIEGLRVSLPSEWKVVSARLFSSATGLQPATVGRDGDGYTITASVESAATFLVEFVSGFGAMTGTVEVAPVVRSGSSTVTLTGESVRRGASVVPDPLRRNRAENHVASFTGNEGFVVESPLQRAASERSRTIALWLRTTATDQVVLSDWTGSEHDPYDLDLLIAPDGTLACYRGRPGHHESMMSSDVLADGRWHHVVVSHDASTRWWRLQVDGWAVDSVRTSISSEASRGGPMVLGRRPAPVDGTAPVSIPGFTGQLDDVTIWPLALSGSVLEEAPYHRDDQLPEPGFVVDFESPVAADGVTLVRADIDRRDPVHRIRAMVEDGSVKLTWESQDRSTAAFAVDRSRDGEMFAEVGRVSPAASGGRRHVFVDPAVPGEVAFYRIRQVFHSGGVRTSPTVKLGLADVMATPGVETSELTVSNFPNPFRESTSIRYVLPDAGFVELSVWDLSGQPVATLVEADLGAGSYEVDFSAAGLPAGAYFVRVQAGGRIASHKLLLVK